LSQVHAIEEMPPQPLLSRFDMYTQAGRRVGGDDRDYRHWWLSQGDVGADAAGGVSRFKLWNSNGACAVVAAASWLLLARRRHAAVSSRAAVLNEFALQHEAAYCHSFVCFTTRGVAKLRKVRIIDQLSQVGSHA
jgi:hypothetical protein